MADGKEKKRIGKREAEGKHLSESSPNPHGESKILQMPIRNRPGSRYSWTQRSTNSQHGGGRLNPSVAHEVRPMGKEKNNDSLQRE